MGGKWCHVWETHARILKDFKIKKEKLKKKKWTEAIFISDKWILAIKNITEIRKHTHMMIMDDPRGSHNTCKISMHP